VNRYGQETPIPAEPRGYRFPGVSPDGKSIVVTVDPRPSSIWVIDAATGQSAPITTDGHHSIGAVWSADGTRIAFNHYVGPVNQIVWMLPQPGAELHSVFAPGSEQRVGDIGVDQWTAADGFFGYRTAPAQRSLRNDVVQFRTGDSNVTTVVSSPAEERRPALSPDGKWLAYASTISGANEVYVRPYPQAGPSVLVSSRGGTEPAWSRDGSELFYRSGSRIMSVAHHPLDRARPFAAPQSLFGGAFDFSQDRNWSPSPDGSFVMVKADPTTARQLRVVLDWFDEVAGASKAR
jgi:hypothetical protein